ncbi:hypothetical protein GCM10010532_068280 [Dactylosporangium siamense]|uniref:Uncharacterized protein n=2 Tax=Dactylosporangium siamense TaxID=685454 RepID=A0A919PMS4_9ACTN|nr:hypothetical protein Dsi01nite_048700 [Dactylosporangium siamense]
MGIGLTTMLRVLDDPRSVPDLRKYFGVGLPLGGMSPFTGGRFELLAGGGDRAASCDVITADDLIAVEMLSVQVPPRIALDLLEGNLGNEVARALHEIPLDAALGIGDADKRVADGSPADTAWRLLTNCDGIGWVTAGKLLARKRPKLIPVYDDVVRCAYGAPTKFWHWLDAKLRERDGVLAQRLAELRGEAGLPREISALRILDVTFWMRHRDQHSRGKGCPGLSDSPPAGGGA